MMAQNALSVVFKGPYLFLKVKF